MQNCTNLMQVLASNSEINIHIFKKNFKNLYNMKILFYIKYFFE